MSALQRRNAPACVRNRRGAARVAGAGAVRKPACAAPLPVRQMVEMGNVKAAYALDAYGLVPAVSKMAFGNKLGVKIFDGFTNKTLFGYSVGDIVLEVSEDAALAMENELTKTGLTDCGYVVGEVTDDATFTYKDVKITMDEALSAWTSPLEKVFKTKSSDDTTAVQSDLYEAKDFYICKNKIAKPRVFIPVFPGTNCEYDSARAFEQAGAITNVKVFKNLTAEDIRESVDEFSRAIAQSQIVMLNQFPHLLPWFSIQSFS